MKVNALQKKNLEIRQNRPNFPSKEVCDIFYDNNLIEICFLSRRCRNDLQGSCIMCNYGAVQGMASIPEYMQRLSDTLNDLNVTIDTILLSTNGSFLDETQIPYELLCTILERISESHIKTVEIETHYRDVTIEKLRLLNRLLPHKRIMIELGLETINSQYHSHIIMKNVNLHDFERTVLIIQNTGIYVECNVMIGLPFLSEKEQYEDALQTIKWVFDHQCAPVLFPINIKPYTLLMDMYQRGHYAPVSHWMIPLILDTLPVEQLEQITVAWYGNREETYSDCNTHTVFPTACAKCSALIYDFYRQFLHTSNGSDRKRVLTNLFSSVSCGCPQQIKEKVHQNPVENFESRYYKYIRCIDIKTD